MKTHRLLIIVCLLFLGCMSKPAPDWLNTAYNQLENYKKNYLSGSERIAAIQFQTAVNEIKKSGNLEILSRAYLIRMSLQTAALDRVDEEEFLESDAIDPSLPNRTFYAFLKGEMNNVDGALLPAQYQSFYRAIRRNAGGEFLREINSMEDPLSRMIALGIAVRLHRDNEDVLKKAIDIASEQGWKKPLLAYLEKLRLYYENTKQTDKAANVQQRIELIRK